MIYGSMKALLPGCLGILATPFSRSGKYGRPSLKILRLEHFGRLHTSIQTTGILIENSLDSLRTSHPIEVNVTKASEINQIFNVISYSKGASVIRMISSFLGEDVFMKGIRIYMHRHKWGNTVSTDLWAALGEASGQDVAKIMNIWTQRVGYPVLVVTETSTGIHIKQQRFLQTGEVTEAEDETIYPIFLALSTTQGIQNIFFDQKTIDVALPDLTFYKLNTGQAGFYRVSYTPSHLLKLGDAMSGGDVLQVEDRMGIIADASALASSGYHKTSTLLALLSPLGTESSSNVWTGIFATLDSIDKAWLFEPEWVREALNAFEKDLFSPQAHALGWEFKAGEDLLQQKLKAALFLKAGSAGDKKYFSLLSSSHPPTLSLLINFRLTSFAEFSPLQKSCSMRVLTLQKRHL